MGYAWGLRSAVCRYHTAEVTIHLITSLQQSLSVNNGASYSRERCRMLARKSRIATTRRLAALRENGCGCSTLRRSARKLPVELLRCALGTRPPRGSTILPDDPTETMGAVGAASADEAPVAAAATCNTQGRRSSLGGRANENLVIAGIPYFI